MSDAPDDGGTEQCRNCEKEGVQEIKAGDVSGWYCEDHWMLAMMLGGKPGERR